VPRPPASIADFLTDASVVQLCAALGDIAHARITVHDERGRRIDYTGGNPPWSVAPEDDAARRIADALHHGSQESIGEDGRVVEPLIVAANIVGAVVIGADPARHVSGELDGLRAIVSKLVLTVNEFCDQEVLLKHRNAELSLLFRLSSLLVAARDTEEVLTIALRSAIEILGAEAGLVHLRDDEGRSALRGHAGLSPEFKTKLSEHTPDSEPFRAALAEAGYPGIVAGSLFFNGRSLGSLRLLWKSPVLLDPEDQALLQTIIEQVSAAVASAKLIEAQSKARAAQRQLRLAADVQRRMLPQSLPNMSRFDIDARYIPTMELGGDFYDLINLSGHLGLLIGDVAGKGVPAALLMAAVRASLRAHASSLYHLDEVMSRVNRAMVRDTQPNEFATIFYGVIDPVSLRLTYCNAGHDPPLLLRRVEGRAAEDRDLYELTAGGMVIGVDPSQAYARGMFDLAPGDTLVAYTDGIVDAMNFESKRFGRPRLRKAILDAANMTGATAKSVADHIIWEVRRSIGLNPQTDDETLVVVRVRK
jgi:sigma-B regulation protein RsbU (phosphoserine phosphatase)